MKAAVVGEGLVGGDAGGTSLVAGRKGSPLAQDCRWRFYDPAPLFACDVCREPHVFFMRRRDDSICCADCWHAAGSPFPRAMGSAAEIFAQEQATRERMKARGGTDRHLVNAGRS